MDSTTLLDQIAVAAGAHVRINELIDALSVGAAYGRRASTCTGLTWGYFGTRYGGSAIANGTNACGASTTTYMVAHRTTGAVSFATATTNWDDSSTYGRCYKIVTSASAITSYEDHRFGTNGIFDSGATASGDVVGPASSTDSHFAQFDGITGNLLKGGIALDTDDTLSADSDTRVPSQQAVKAYVDAATSAPDADDVTYTPTTLADWDGGTDPGDVEQALDQLAERVTDVEGASGSGDVVGPASSVASEIALFDGATGKLLKSATGTGYAKVTSGVLSADSTATVQANLQGTGTDVDACGFRGIPQNAQTGNYTCVASDAGKHIYHASGDGAGDTYTIPANGSVAYEVGTAITFVNLDSSAVSIAITTDTMYLGGTGTTGTRSLAQYGVATALKVGSTTWVISGPGLT
jgi:hypothetical protein